MHPYLAAHVQAGLLTPREIARRERLMGDRPTALRQEPPEALPKKAISFLVDPVELGIDVDDYHDFLRNHGAPPSCRTRREQWIQLLRKEFGDTAGRKAKDILLPR